MMLDNVIDGTLVGYTNYHFAIKEVKEKARKKLDFF